MVLVQNYGLAVFLCFVAMVCWGSWQNTQNLIGKEWRFELFYWDYSIGILLFALIMAFTFGSFGEEGRSFMPDLAQADPKNLLSSALGGFIWNIGTLLLVASISIAGMSVAFPIGGGIGWTLGILINYIGKPEGNPALLFGGTAVIILAILVSMQSYRKLAVHQKKPSFKGIALAFAAGLCIAFFYRFVASSMATDFSPADDGKISSYTAVVFFSIGALLSTIIVNPIFMARPVQGSPVKFSEWIRGNSRAHLLGMLGGAIWCLGNSVSFMSVGAASPAISYGLSNAAPVVAALWGIFIWKEFRDAPKGTNLLLTLMFAFYLVGLVLIVYSRFA
ncbi:MAG: multidrug DMT transporter permease [Bacteroidetes bacterium GWE2_41_25]|nr:MAG: multidrug DMT transporter permease [Bacteroidetes bacterium GWA2_40_15]OFX91678.1 MAG: multidrug DMT transporter permease [Bacteroidetes bacterium GWE2_41_25]OFX97628.1 MAG: multidrug DMT transporter permease [Bacteroidetes bacterium GWC2_40_22]OFY58936.1 MAG: multidrug DMT transporter permease [Bacteroidetes bacterium GWF2_41_9]HAM10104.1 multidrug DMT transporter permease [Bacteroidales bacterium]